MGTHCFPMQIGPSLIGDTHQYPRFTSDKEILAIIYGGATGAIQPFGKRLTQIRF